MRKAMLMFLVMFLVSVFAGVLSAQEYVPPQAKVFIEKGNTVDISGEIEDRELKGEFDMAITAAFYKKKVPVTVVLDIEKAGYVIRHSSTRDEDGGATKVVKTIFGAGGLNPFKRYTGVEFAGTFMVIRQEDSAILFSYNVKKNNFQSAADAFAKHFKNHIKDGVEKKN